MARTMIEGQIDILNRKFENHLYKKAPCWLKDKYSLNSGGKYENDP